MQLVYKTWADASAKVSNIKRIYYLSAITLSSGIPKD